MSVNFQPASAHPPPNHHQPQGDSTYTKAQQFGIQVVLSTESTSGDNPLLGAFSNVEVRQAGQGLKLGKYPIHFHLVGNVSNSYVRNCSVHHSFNRAIAIHGVDGLLVEYNVVFDTRGHTIFIEDGESRCSTLVGGQNSRTHQLTNSPTRQLANSPTRQLANSRKFSIAH